MRGFHKIYGVNWLTDPGTGATVIYGTNEAVYVSAFNGQLPEHWERVKQMLLSKNN